MKTRIIPSIIARNQKELDDLLNKARKLGDVIHLDFMDGVFVENESLNFDISLIKGLNYEAHLMVENPLKFFKKFLKNEDLKTFIIHYESRKSEIIEIIEFIKKNGRRVGLAINPKTSFDEVKNLLPKVDKVLVMNVFPGGYGSKFLEETVSKVRLIHEKFPKILIESDGGLNPETSLMNCEAGASLSVCGSYLMKSENPEKSLKNLNKALKKCSF